MEPATPPSNFGSGSTQKRPASQNLQYLYIQYIVFFEPAVIETVLRIRIRMDPELLPGSGIIYPDPKPAKKERADK